MTAEYSDFTCFHKQPKAVRASLQLISCVRVRVCVCVFWPFLGLLLWHMEVPRLGV